MKTDNRGCSTCQKGQESYEEYFSAMLGGHRVQYDYRAEDGELFTTDAKSLEIARERRDKWLASR